MAKPHCLNTAKSHPCNQHTAPRQPIDENSTADCNDGTQRPHGSTLGQDGCPTRNFLYGGATPAGTVLQSAADSREGRSRGTWERSKVAFRKKKYSLAGTRVAAALSWTLEPVGITVVNCPQCCLRTMHMLTLCGPLSDLVRHCNYSYQVHCRTLSDIIIETQKTGFSRSFSRKSQENHSMAEWERQELRQVEKKGVSHD
ncbi:UNVERIFIED_CONTAM: hypothetical protein FKN15_061331 [Acipenser sinensis]